MQTSLMTGPTEYFNNLHVSPMFDKLLARISSSLSFTPVRSEARMMLEYLGKIAPHNCTDFIKASPIFILFSGELLFQVLSLPEIKVTGNNHEQPYSPSQFCNRHHLVT